MRSIKRSTSNRRPDAAISGAMFPWGEFERNVSTNACFVASNLPAPIKARKPNCCSMERRCCLILYAWRYSFCSK